MRAKLTKRVVDALSRPAQTREIVWDATLPGFGCRVTPAGHKAFVIQYRVGGRSKQLTIGNYGLFTVEHARDRAKKLLGDVAAGADPASELEARHDAHRERLGAPTLESLVPAFLDYCRARCKSATVDEYERIFKHDITPKLGSCRVADLTTKQVIALHASMRKRQYAANRALARLSTFCTWAERTEVRPRHSNPCSHVRPYNEVAKERYLSDAEFQNLRTALETAETVGLPPAPAHRMKPKSPATAKHRPKKADTPIPANASAIAVIRFLLLSGWREGEVLSLKWVDVDFDRQFATLSNTKTGRSLRPLGASALTLLDELRRTEKSEYVFPDADGRSHVKEIRRVWYAVRHAAKLGDVRLHDLRHTFASIAAGAGQSLPMIGALLGHVRSETTKRYAHLTEDVRTRSADEVSRAVAAHLGRGSK